MGSYALRRIQTQNLLAGLTEGSQRSSLQAMVDRR